MINQVNGNDSDLKRISRIMSQRSKPHQAALCLRFMHVSFPDGERFSFKGIELMFASLQRMGFSVDVINFTFPLFKSYRAFYNSNVSMTALDIYFGLLAEDEDEDC